MIVIRILNVQRFEGLLGAVVAAARFQVVVVQMPGQRWPGVVQHPFNYTGRLVLITAVSFEHRTLVVVRDELCLSNVII